tara:strand:+ start:1100 stop:1984 length:885 start_codon:yes stop_codon:yes gene_type:complete
MLTNKIPSFFVIGMQKAGTSTLHSLLKQDKRFSLPYRKETHFFSTNFNKGIDWYIKHFDNNNNSIKGEIDPSYIFFPNALKNIKKYIVNPKFIIIMRRPLDRAYSHYLMSKARGYETLTFNEALLNEDNRLSNNKNLFNFSNFSYLNRSKYFDLITKLKLEFKKSDILYLKFDDLLTTDGKQRLINQIYNFLNLSINENINYNIHKNKSHTYRFEFLNNLIYKDSIIRSLLKYIVLSEKHRYMIINYINSLNSKQYKFKSNYMHDIDPCFIKINNNECNLLINEIDFNAKDWII